MNNRNKEVRGMKISTLPDGNCAFNAFILSGLNALVNGLLDVLDTDNEPTKIAKEMSQQCWRNLLRKCNITNKNEWDQIKLDLKNNHKTYDAQTKLQIKLQQFLREEAATENLNDESYIALTADTFVAAFDTYYENKKNHKINKDDIFIKCRTIEDYFKKQMVNINIKLKQQINDKGHQLEKDIEENIRNDIAEEIKDQWTEQYAKIFIEYTRKPNMWVGDLELSPLAKKYGVGLFVTGQRFYWRESNIQSSHGDFLIKGREILSRLIPMHIGTIKSRSEGKYSFNPINPEELQFCLDMTYVIDNQKYQFTEEEKEQIEKIYKNNYISRPKIVLINENATHWDCVDYQGNWLKNKYNKEILINLDLSLTKKEPDPSYPPAVVNLFMTSGKNNELESDKANKKGDQKFKHHQYKAATKYYRKACRLNPKNALAFFNLGNAKLNRGFYEDAIRHFDKAVSLNPLYADAFTGLGFAKVNLGRKVEAEQDYKKAEEIKNQNIISQNKPSQQIDQSSGPISPNKIETTTNNNEFLSLPNTSLEPLPPKREELAAMFTLVTGKKPLSKQIDEYLLQLNIKGCVHLTDIDGQSQEYNYQSVQDFVMARYIVNLLVQVAEIFAKGPEEKPKLNRQLLENNASLLQDYDKTIQFLVKQKYTTTHQLFFRFIAKLLSLPKNAKGFPLFWAAINTTNVELIGLRHQVLLVTLLGQLSFLPELSQQALPLLTQERDVLLCDLKMWLDHSLCDENSATMKTLSSALSLSPILADWWLKHLNDQWKSYASVQQQRAFLHYVLPLTKFSTTVLHNLQPFFTTSSGIAEQLTENVAIDGPIQTTSDLCQDVTWQEKLMLPLIDDVNSDVRKQAWHSLLQLGRRLSGATRNKHKEKSQLLEEALLLQIEESYSEEALSKIILGCQELGELSKKTELALMDLLKHEEVSVRESAVLAFGHLKQLSHPEAEHALVDLLKDKNEYIWKNAVRAFRQLKHLSTPELQKEAELTLVALLKVWDIHQIVVKVFSQLKQLTYPEAEHALVDLLREEDKENKKGHVRKNALEAFDQLKQLSTPELQKKAELALVALLKDEHGYNRKIAVEVFGRLKQLTTQNEAELLLVALLKDDNKDVRDSAVKTFGQLKQLSNPKAEHRLVDLLNEEDKENKKGHIRKNVLEAFGQLAKLSTPELQKKAELALMGMLKDTNKEVRDAAVEAFGQFKQLSNSEAEQGLVDLLKNKEGYVRNNAVRVFGQLKQLSTPELQKEAELTLVVLLKDKEGFVRQSAIDALGQLKQLLNTQAEKGLVALLEYSRFKSAELRTGAVQAFGQLTQLSTPLLQKEAELALVTLLEKDPKSRDTACKVLKQIAKTLAHDTIIALQKLTKSKVATFANQILEAITSPQEPCIIKTEHLKITPSPVEKIPQDDDKNLESLTIDALISYLQRNHAPSSTYIQILQQKLCQINLEQTRGVLTLNAEILNKLQLAFETGKDHDLFLYNLLLLMPNQTFFVNKEVLAWLTDGLKHSEPPIRLLALQKLAFVRQTTLINKEVYSLLQTLAQKMLPFDSIEFHFLSLCYQEDKIITLNLILHALLKQSSLITIIEQLFSRLNVATEVLIEAYKVILLELNKCIDTNWLETKPVFWVPLLQGCKRMQDLITLDENGLYTENFRLDMQKFKMLTRIYFLQLLAECCVQFAKEQKLPSRAAEALAFGAKQIFRQMETQSPERHNNTMSFSLGQEQHTFSRNSIVTLDSEDKKPIKTKQYKSYLPKTKNVDKLDKKIIIDHTEQLITLRKLLMSEKFKGTNSTGIAQIIKIIESGSLCNEEKIQKIICFAKAKTNQAKEGCFKRFFHALSYKFSNSSIFRNGRHKNIEELYQKLAKQTGYNLTEIIEFIDPKDKKVTRSFVETEPYLPHYTYTRRY